MHAIDNNFRGEEQYPMRYTWRPTENYL
jgi:hypothetical protein